jgi:hypothetical protein
MTVPQTWHYGLIAEWWAPSSRCAPKWRDGELVATEDRQITLRMYFRDEVLLMLDRAGFSEVDVRGGYADEEPTADHEFLVYIARP